MAAKSTTSSDSRFKMDKDVDCYLIELLHKVKENPLEPLQFLSHVLDEINDDNIQRSIKRSDIDFQLASLIKRVETNVSILERTNKRVKDINFIAEKNKIFASRKLNYEKTTLSQKNEDKLKTELNIEHPEIDAAQHMMNSTLQILKGMKKITINDLDSKTLSSGVK